MLFYGIFIAKCGLMSGIYICKEEQKGKKWWGVGRVVAMEKPIG